MFEQQEHVADLACFTQFEELPLEAQAFAIVKHPELDYGNQVVVRLSLEMDIAKTNGGGTPPYHRYIRIIDLAWESAAKS